MCGIDDILWKVQKAIMIVKVLRLRLSIDYIQHIRILQLFIVNLNVFICLGQGKPKDFEIGIKDLKENIDKTLRSTPNMK